MILRENQKFSAALCTGETCARMMEQVNCSTTEKLLEQVLPVPLRRKFLICDLDYAENQKFSAALCTGETCARMMEQVNCSTTEKLLEQVSPVPLRSQFSDLRLSNFQSFLSNIFL